MNAASQVPSGGLLSTSVSTTDAAAEPAPAAALQATSDIATKSRRGRAFHSSLFLGLWDRQALQISSVTKYIRTPLEPLVAFRLLARMAEAFEETIPVPTWTKSCRVSHALAYIQQMRLNSAGRGLSTGWLRSSEGAW